MSVNNASGQDGSGKTSDAKSAGASNMSGASNTSGASDSEAPANLAAKVAAVLRRIAGLEVDLVGASSVARVVSARIQHLRDAGRTANLDAYLQLIEWDREEQQWLIEAVVVPETWFFRHSQAFDYLQVRAQEHLRQYARGVNTGGIMRPWRIASVPCSTGEEPYSIAMALLDAEMPSTSFTIDAIDISSAALEEARVGFYRRNAFRGNDTTFQKRYFVERDDGWQIAASVRTCVNFRVGNLMLEELFAAEAQYDVVFCRNVLIYFDRPTQHAVVTRLSRALRPDGVLFVGPAESALASKAGLTAPDAPLSFAFLRSEAKGARPAAPFASASTLSTLSAMSALSIPAASGVPATPSPGTISATGSAGSAASLRSARSNVLPRRMPTPLGADYSQAGGKRSYFSGASSLSSASASPAVSSNTITGRASTATDASPSASAATSTSAAGLLDAGLAEAERLANQGEFDAAMAACTGLLAARGPSAAVYHLLGLIADARGFPNEAREHFRRAVYLDANHAGALLQLAAHAEMDGDAAGAERLMSRARRARPDLF